MGGGGEGERAGGVRHTRGGWGHFCNAATHCIARLCICSGPILCRIQPFERNRNSSFSIILTHVLRTLVTTYRRDRLLNFYI